MHLEFFFFQTSVTWRMRASLIWEKSVMVDFSCYDTRFDIPCFCSLAVLVHTESFVWYGHMLPRKISVKL